MRPQSGRRLDYRAGATLYGLYGVVWLSGLAAALLALFGEGGFKVTILAVVPLVLLAPTAFYGIRHFMHRVMT